MACVFVFLVEGRARYGADLWRSARGRLISLAGRNLLLSSHGDGRRRGREGTSLSQGRKGPGCRLATSEHRGQSYSG